MSFFLRPLTHLRWFTNRPSPHELSWYAWGQTRYLGRGMEEFLQYGKELPPRPYPRGGSIFYGDDDTLAQMAHQHAMGQPLSIPKVEKPTQSR